MVCPKCNSQNQEGAKFCRQCGYFLETKKSPFILRHKWWFISLFPFFIFFILPVYFMSALLGSLGEELVKQESEEAVVSGFGEDKIALINIDGVIVEKEPTGGLGAVAEEITSARKIKKTLQQVADDPKVKILVVRVNSPGGSAVASEEIYKEFSDFKRRTGMKIVVYFSDIAASGGYYVSMAADKIVANPSSITGSIGVIISYFNFQDLAQKYGVEMITYKSGPYKDIVSEFRKPTEEEKAIIQSVVSDSFDNFVNAVAQGRKLPVDQVRQLADGRIYSAKQAVDLKLIDGLGTFEEAIDTAKDLAGISQASVVEFGRPDFFELLLGNFSGKFNLSLTPNLGNYFSSQPGPRVLYLYSP